MNEQRIEQVKINEALISIFYDEITRQYPEVADCIKEIDCLRTQMFMMQYELLSADVNEDFLNTLDVLACFLDAKNHNIMMELKRNFLKMSSIIESFYKAQKTAKPTVSQTQIKQ